MASSRFPRPRRRARGVALLLVVIAVGAATVLGVTFLAAQSTSSAVATNIEHHGHARHIAESGLALAIGYVQSAPDWRQQRSEGMWIDAESFADGTFTIHAYDGADADNTGQYSGDGDFASDHSEPVTLIATAAFNGATARVEAVVHPGVAAQSGVSGIAVATEIDFGNHAHIDSYDSTAGPYGGANVSEHAVVATQSTDGGMIDFGNHGSVHGSLYVGVDGSPDSGIGTGNHFHITGEQAASTEHFDLPGCSPPDLGASQGDKKINNNRTEVVSADVKWDEFDAGNNVTLQIIGNVTIHVTDDFAAGNRFSIVLAPGATLELYVDGGIDLGNDAQLNHDSARARDLTIYNCGSDDIDLGNNARVAGTIISPHAGMDAGNGLILYGMFLGYELNIGNHAHFHQDLSLLGPSPTGGGSPGDTHRVIWR